MIRYTLKCSKDHVFESWFSNAGAYEALKASGHLACAVCGATDVEKTLMAPAVAQKDADAPSTLPEAPGALSQPSSPQEMMFQQMKTHLEKNSSYVGKDFAKTARAMHDGEAPDRAIHGEASLAEAKSLVEDGVPVAPLPFMPTRKTN